MMQKPTFHSSMEHEGTFLSGSQGISPATRGYHITQSRDALPLQTHNVETTSEHPYAEIQPLPPSREIWTSAGHEPLYQSNIKDTDYQLRYAVDNKYCSNPSQKNSKNHLTKCQVDFIQGNGPYLQRNVSSMVGTLQDQASTNNNLENGGETCKTQVKDTTGCLCHGISPFYVLVLTLCGLLYLLIGGGIGFYLGKQCKYCYYMHCSLVKMLLARYPNGHRLRFWQTQIELF